MPCIYCFRNSLENVRELREKSEIASLNLAVQGNVSHLWTVVLQLCYFVHEV